MRKIISLIALFFLQFSVLIVPSQAATGIWAEFDGWTVYGDTDNRSCAAVADYLTGRQMMIMFFDNDQGRVITSIAISGIQVREGRNYDVFIHASTGERGILKAIASANNTIIFLDVNENTIRALANARDITIQGLGTFELTGSKKAMASAWQCFEMLTSF